jgi:hypothetical protein
LGTFWLTIEQFWPFEVISIFSNGSHLGYRTALMDTIMKGDHPRIISAKLGCPKLCPVIPTSNQDGRQAKNRKRGDEIQKKTPLKLLSQSQPSFAEMILGWSPFIIVSISAVLYPRWLFLISSPFFLICIIGQNRQKVKVHKKSRNIC